MSKFIEELTDYAKASGAFEYAAKRYSNDNQNQVLRQEVKTTFNYLKNVAFPKMEKLYKNNPEDKDAISAFEIAYRDLMQMQNLFNSLPQFSQNLKEAAVTFRFHL